MALSDLITANPAVAPVPYVQGQVPFPRSSGGMPNMPSGTQQVMGSLEQILSSGSPYIENARRRGMEVAGARGGINSSIAAGTSERAAIEAALPLVQQAGQIDQTANNVKYDNWLAEQNFGRALKGQRFSSSLGMLQAIQQYGLEDPELYTPDVISGFSNFFERNANDIMKRYFGA